MANLFELGSPLPSALRVDRSQLPPEVTKALRPLMRPDPTGYLFQWCLSWLSVVIAIAVAVRADHIAVTVAAILFVGTRQNLLALLMHEQTHWLGSRSRWGDYFCELFVAYPLMVTLEGYRGVHLAHHGNYFTDADPDYVRKQGREWTFPQQIGFFAVVVLRDLTGLNVIKNLRSKSLSQPDPTIKARFYPPRWLRPAFLLALCTCLTLTHTWPIFLLYWLLPLLTVMQGIIRLGAITEHKYNLVNPSVEESTPLIELLWWEKLLLPNLNFTLHVYHHWFPTIPASRLPQVHRICREAGLVDEAHIFRGYAAYLRFLLHNPTEKVASSSAAPAPSSLDGPPHWQFQSPASRRTD